MYLTLNLVSLTVWRSSSAGWALTIRSQGNSSTGRWPPLVGGWVLATQWRTIHNSWLLKTAINSAYQPSIWRSSASLRNVSIILTDQCPFWRSKPSKPHSNLCFGIFLSFRKFKTKKGKKNKKIRAIRNSIKLVRSDVLATNTIHFQLN